MPASWRQRFNSSTDSLALLDTPRNATPLRGVRLRHLGEARARRPSRPGSPARSRRSRSRAPSRWSTSARGLPSRSSSVKLRTESVRAVGSGRSRSRAAGAARSRRRADRSRERRRLPPDGPGRGTPAARHEARRQGDSGRAGLRDAADRASRCRSARAHARIPPADAEIAGRRRAPAGNETDREGWWRRGESNPRPETGDMTRTTRVVRGLSSASAAPTDRLVGGPAGNVLPPAVRRRTGDQPTNDGPVHPVGEGGGPRCASCSD